MKSINDMTRKEFYELKTFKWGEGAIVDSLVLLPTRKHDDSGYNLYDIVACYHNQALGKIGIYDTHSIIMNSKWNRVGIDCLRGSSLMRIFLPDDDYEITPWRHQTAKKGKI